MLSVPCGVNGLALAALLLRCLLQVYLSVQTLQLDNQLMDTQRPVVLSPSNTPSHQNSKDLAMR